MIFHMQQTFLLTITKGLLIFSISELSRQTHLVKLPIRLLPFTYHIKIWQTSCYIPKEGLLTLSISKFS